MNRDSSLKATSKFSEQSQFPVINGKGNGQLMYKKKGSKKTQHDSSVKNGKPSSVFKRRVFCFSKSFPENRFGFSGTIILFCWAIKLLASFILSFAPMNGGTASELPDTNSWKQPFDAQRYFSHSESD
uniref:Uncharacterized protein n=1 Tax=Quercus lobata TaxID=97700 RepID=A0A7N2MQD3_QUELO